MESNEETELTRKIETDSQVESRLTALGRVWGRAWRGQAKKEKNRERTQGHGQHSGNCGARGQVGGGRRGHRGDN